MTGCVAMRTQSGDMLEVPCNDSGRLGGFLVGRNHDMAERSAAREERLYQTLYRELEVGNGTSEPDPMAWFRSLGGLQPRLCRQCGGKFQPPTYRHFYCGATCLKNRVRAVHWAAEQKRPARKRGPRPENSGRNTKSVAPRPCAECGESWTPKRHNTRFCSDKCGYGNRKWRRGDQ